MKASLNVIFKNQVPIATIKKGLRDLSYLMKVENYEKRTFVCGLLFKAIADKAEFVSTDIKRIAISKFTLNDQQ